MGYSGPELFRATRNAVTASKHPMVVSDYILKEISLRHTVGTFRAPPLDDFAISSLRVRPKKTGGARLIMDLSRPFGSSVNDFILREDYSMNSVVLMTRLRL